MLQSRTLVVEGSSVVPEITPVILPSEWSILGYLRNNPGPIQIMLADIVSNISIVKNDIGSVYWPVYGVNLIVDMLPGKGYQIKMDMSDTLVYQPNNMVFQKSSGNNISHLKHNTGNNMTIGIPYHLLNGLNDNYRFIVARNSEGLLAGKTEYQKNNIALTVWGDDEFTSWKDGLYPLEEVSIFLVDKDGSEYKFIVDSWLSGGSVYKINEINVAASVKISESGEDVFLYQNNPNPFDLSTEISFNIKEAIDVQILVYDFSGKMVRNTGISHFSKGINRIEFESKDLPSGIYIYKLISDQFVVAKKMTIIR